MRAVALLLGFVLIVAAGLAIRQFAPSPAPQTLVVGKVIQPLGNQQDVGSFPDNLAMSPDGAFLFATDSGFRQQISVLDAFSGKLVGKVGDAKTPLYYGLACATIDGTTMLYASGGSADKVYAYRVGADGSLEAADSFDDPASVDPEKVGRFPAGICLTPDGSKLLVVENESTPSNGFHGALAVFDTKTRSLIKRIELPAFPLAVAYQDGRAFCTCERDGALAIVDIDRGHVDLMRTGDNESALLADARNHRLFVSNSNSDTVSVIDTTRRKLARTLELSSRAFASLRGGTPLGMTETPDGRLLFVAMADMNAVAVVDTQSMKLAGYLPAGWYPTAVQISRDGRRLFVANAKGVQAKNPNGKPVGALGRYAPNIIEGDVSTISLAEVMPRLIELTDEVVADCSTPLGRTDMAAKQFIKPNIGHVIYVIKENRTYDQVLGDMPEGNGDPDLCMFPKDVTPNQHALAARFGLFDNFYACAEVSADGWNWSTAGIANEYTERNVFTNYSGHGRSYDFEGTNNGAPVDLDGERDVAQPPGGYIWDQCARQGVSYRNYGFFVAFGSDEKRPNGKPLAVDNAPDRKALVGHTCLDFRRFDLDYPDSDAWLKLGVAPAPKQLKSYGSHGDPSRISAWLREFHGYERRGDLPKFTMLRLPRNHTAGTTSGMSSPRACVADNDYAVGRLVEAVSHSRYWKDTVICILEDDAQAGYDHVDCHRSPILVVSPYCPAGQHDGNFYNTDSMLRTMELLLGLKPMTQYDALARPIAAFGNASSNDAAYDAILPAKEIIGEVNSSSAYRAADSARLISRYQEESGPDMELNDILWGSTIGKPGTRPNLVRRR